MITRKVRVTPRSRVKEFATNEFEARDLELEAEYLNPGNEEVVVN